MKGRHLTIVIKLGMQGQGIRSSSRSHCVSLGTSSIVNEKTRNTQLPTLSLIVDAAVRLVKDGHRVVIVSSGAIAMGMRKMKIEKRPKSLARTQALASNGQCHLIALWVYLFGQLDQEVSQILLTRNDIADRTQYLNAQNTFTEAFNMGMIPIVNENDTIAVSEIRAIEKFGDNDTLSAITAAMVQADYLFLMTDVDCLYDKNPRTHPDATPIEVVSDISALEADVSSSGSALGTGGMSTKIVAARLATSAGVTTIITHSSKPSNIFKIVDHLQWQRGPTEPPSSSILSQPQRAAPTADPPPFNSTFPLSQPLVSSDKAPPPLHTRFLPNQHPIRDRSFWLLHGLAPHGTIFIDEGAFKALSSKAGLLPVGIVDVEGSFAQQEAVRLVVVKQKSLHALIAASNVADAEGVPIDGPPVEVGRALVNYSAAEISRIKGLRSTEIGGVLGYADSEYVALRENVSLMRKVESRPVTPGSPRGGIRAYQDG